MQPVHEESEHRFVIRLPQGTARLEYELRPGEVDFTHTLVPAELRGRGLAEQLVRAGLAWAQAGRLHVRASCSYVARHLERSATRPGSASGPGA